MRKFFLILLAIALMGALILVGCPKPAPTTTPTQTAEPTATTTTPAPPKVLKVGATLNQGATGQGGLQQARWYDLYAKLVNDAGGWKIGNDTYMIDMICYDNQGDPIKEKSDIEKLVLQDGVKYILYGSQSPAVDITVTEPNKVIVLGSDLSDVSADPNVQYFYQADGMHFARGLGYIIAIHMVERGVKNYVSVKPDSEFGHFATIMGDVCWQANGVEMAGEVYFAPDQSDFSPIATKIMSYKTDLVDLNYSSNVVQIYSALHDAGYEGIILPSFADQALVDNLVTMCGKEFIEGGECFYQDPRGYQTDPKMVALMDAYVAEYGNFGTEGVLFSGSWFYLEDAVEHTHSVDVEVIKAYLDSSDHAVRTLCGYNLLVARPDMNNPRTMTGAMGHYIAIIHDGKLEIRSTCGVKDQLLSSILTFGQADLYKEYWDANGYPNFPDEESTIKYTDLGITGHD